MKMNKNKEINRIKKQKKIKKNNIKKKKKRNFLINKNIYC